MAKHNRSRCNVVGQNEHMRHFQNLECMAFLSSIKMNVYCLPRKFTFLLIFDRVSYVTKNGLSYSLCNKRFLFCFAVLRYRITSTQLYWNGAYLKVRLQIPY